MDIETCVWHGYFFFFINTKCTWRYRYQPNRCPHRAGNFFKVHLSHRTRPPSAMKIYIAKIHIWDQSCCCWCKRKVLLYCYGWLYVTENGCIVRLFASIRNVCFVLLWLIVWKVGMKTDYWWNIFLSQNICCGYSKEPSQWYGSFEHQKHMFRLLGKKIFTILRSNFVFV